MKECRRSSFWRGVTAVTLVAAAAVISIVYGIMAVLLFRQARR